MILGPDGLPIAGSANASVRRGMMRNVGARFDAFSNPYDYEVNYLQSFSAFVLKGAYIDCGLKLTNDHSLFAIASGVPGVTHTPNSDVNVIIGAGNDGGSVLACVGQWLVADCFSSGYGRRWWLQDSYMNDEIHEFFASKSNCYIKRSNQLIGCYNSQNTASSFTTQTNCNLFSNSGYNTNVVKNPIRIMRAKIALNGSLVRDFVPVVKDNVGYMFDMCGSICPLTGTSLYANAGTGAFTWG